MYRMYVDPYWTNRKTVVEVQEQYNKEEMQEYSARWQSNNAYQPVVLGEQWHQDKMSASTFRKKKEIEGHQER